MAAKGRITFAEIRQGTVEWIRGDLARTARVAGIAFAVSWAVNFAVITTRGGSLGNLVAGSTEGNQAVGAFYWAIVSLAITSVVVYGLEVGWSELRSAFRALPNAIARMFREHGVRMWAIVLWGAAVTLAISGAITPTLSAAFGIAILAFLPTAITGLLGRIITSIWVGLIGFFAPKAKPAIPGVGAQLVAIFGSALGFLVATQATETAFKLIAAAAFAVLSHVAVINSASRVGKAAAVILMGLAWWVGSEAVAQALGGCCGGEAHHHPLDPGAAAAGFSAIGGGAGAAGGVVGAGVGTVLARHPQDPSRWDDPGGGGGGGPRVTNDPIPPGPTRTTTVMLEGDAARAALDAWRRAGGDEGEADIPLPEDEQWDVVVRDEQGNLVERSGHSGTRGRITGIGPIAEGDDNIVISVEVTAYTPSQDAEAPADAPAPPAEGTAGGSAGGSGGQADTATPVEDGTDTSTEVSADPPPADDTAPAPADEIAEEPLPPGDDEPPPPPPPPPAALAPQEEAEEPEEDKPEAKDEGVPDGTDPDALARWLDGYSSNTLTPTERSDLGALLRGEANSATITGKFGGWGSYLSTEARSDGAALKFPTRDRIVVRVRDGRVEAKHEASMISLIVDAVAEKAEGVGIEIPKVEEVIARAQEPMESINRSLDATGREMESIVRHPDGSITFTTRPTG